MKNKGLANKAAQNRLPGFRVLSQFFLQSISRCAILLYTDHKKHPVFLLRIVSFYRCDPRPSRGLQPEFLNCVNFVLHDAIRAPHGDKLGFYPPCTAIPPDVELRCPTSGGILWYVGGLSRAEWQRVTYAANLSVPIYKGMDAQN